MKMTHSVISWFTIFTCNNWVRKIIAFISLARVFSIYDVAALQVSINYTRLLFEIETLHLAAHVSSKPALLSMAAISFARINSLDL